MWFDLSRLLWDVDQPPHDPTDYPQLYLDQGGHRIVECLGPSTAALAHFKRRSSEVTRNRASYDELLLVARVIHHLAWREHHGSITRVR